MKFQKGDLVTDSRCGGFGSMSQGAKVAVVLNVGEGQHEGEYELYYIEGFGREWRIAQMVNKAPEIQKARVADRIKALVDKLNEHELKSWEPMYEVRKALRMAT